ncbi:MAG: M4 family metallopeptidase, partial [Salibacteraceae bacterium]
MRKLLPLFILFNILTLSISAEEILRGKQANEAVEGAELVRFKDFSSIPAYIKFRTNERIAFQSWQTWFSSRYLKNASNVDFMLIGEEEDRMGMIHYRYQQRVEGYPMTFGIWIVHTLNGEVVSMNGEVFDKPGSHSPSLSEANALEFALDKINASIYKWELPEEETWLKIEQADQNATYFPKGELEVINSDASLKKLDLHLAWKFNIYAAEPLSRTEIYVDANDGSVIFEQDLIHHADSNGIANTGYSGQQNIVADYTGTNFRLRESGRGNGVHTFDMNNGTNHGAATDVFDNDNVWNATTVERFATDAHWGAEMTYDYYFNYFNRNSIDGNGFLLRSYVHYGNNYANAFWDGQRMTYGDGNNGNSAFTALDIAGHEVTHGLTTFTAGLIYQNESGALNESFSDIFGAAIEFDALGYSNGDWLMGEDLGFIIRYMSNPNQGGDPDTYDGNFWYVGPNDNGGVHTNSGVQNFWFYLLTEGGTGTNDIGNQYNVTAVGVEDAGAIAYRNLVTYLTVSSQYSDARFYAIESAMDLFGPCSQQVISTGNAWYAVG